MSCTPACSTCCPTERSRTDASSSTRPPTARAGRRATPTGSRWTSAGTSSAPAPESRLPSPGPSQIASDYHPHVVPKAMERADIRRVQADWVWAAERSREAGFDIVYVYGGHSYLLTQFLSPFYNRRTDEYGGPPGKPAPLSP